MKIRIADAKVGDVVNRDAESDEGWFEVASLDTLFNGSLQVADETTYITITGGEFDTIALQVVTEVDLPSQRPPVADVAPVAAAAPEYVPLKDMPQTAEASPAPAPQEFPLPAAH